MVFLIHLNRGRWVFILCLGLSPSYLLGATSDWDCQRSKDDKEWVCITKKSKPDTAATTPDEPEIEKAGPTQERESAPATAEPEPVRPPKSREPALAAKPARSQRDAEQKRVDQFVQPLPPKSVAAAKPPGWNCRPGETGKEWDCSLVGPDPKGLPHVVSEESQKVENWAETTTITEEDEQRFRNLTALLPANPWAQACAGKSESAPMTEFLLTPQDRLAREQQPLEIRSDYAEMVDDEIATFTGSAELTRADQKLWGDFVTHNTVSETLNAQGNVIYQEKGLTFSSDTGFLELDTNRGVLRNAQFILETIPARGTSRLTHFDSDTLSRYEKFTYTTCPPGDQDWMLHARNVKINKETGRGSAKHAWLEFKGVPLLYTPYMSFPVDDRRMTGFLTPSFGNTKVGGFDFTAPYYFNLAPNYDATFTPRLLTKRGLLLRGDFRYLTEMTRGRVLAEYMPQDDVRGDSRGQVGFLNDTRFTENLYSRVDAHYVSDDRYLNELGNTLNIVDRRHIRSYGQLNYVGSNYSISTLADYYQTIDPTIPPEGRPYYRLPQVSFNYGQGLGNTGLVFNGFSEIANFNHTGGRVTGQRLNVIPRISYPWRTAAGFVVPSLSLQHTQYWLQDQTPGLNDSLSRTAPIFSLDSGLFFEREFELAETPLLQTLEPRLFYLYIPDKNQENLPVFDTGEYDFTFYQLFRENRFTGADRLGDANQVTLALTSRLIDQVSGMERLRASIGEIFYFDDHDVTLPNIPAKTGDKSNFVAEVYSRLTNTWSLRTGGQWNPEGGTIDRGQVALQYDDRDNHLLNIAYRFRRDQNFDFVRLDLTDVSFRLPFAKGWNAIGRWQYSLLDQVTLESFLGIERETCCWRFSLIGRHYINDVRTGVNGGNVANNGVFVQLELKGLTRFGDQVDRFLQRSISGYRLEND
ncbi:LPS assembly protein LptD [Methylocaldum sp. GT1TLB]|uniref:LPS-assembly protein LptD n=1 Tax=Methylocaldum sp. GT1TLB TaxID=3438965 RepID=UPI003DA109AA